jgi:hypothetical protein
MDGVQFSTKNNCAVIVRFWHVCDIARSRMDVRFRGKSGRAADIAGTTEFDPKRSYRPHDLAMEAWYHPSIA